MVGKVFLQGSAEFDLTGDLVVGMNTLLDRHRVIAKTVQRRLISTGRNRCLTPGSPTGMPG
jgi:hypothetical protein